MKRRSFFAQIIESQRSPKTLGRWYIHTYSLHSFEAIYAFYCSISISNSACENTRWVVHTYLFFAQRRNAVSRQVPVVAHHHDIGYSWVGTKGMIYLITVTAKFNALSEPTHKPQKSSQNTAFFQ